jgi:EmrB/QacA subfamily drug resistance transporter
MSTEDAPPHHLDRRLLTIAGVVVLGAIMTILDTTIMGVAINTLARDFDTSLSTIQWVSTGYMLALATVIPLTGWAAGRYGSKRLWVVSLVLFVLGSALSGAASSVGMLIVFRVLQGLGGGMIVPVGMTMLVQAAGHQRMGRVMAIVSVPLLLGPIFGPMLGGVLVTEVSWRWIFYINLPIGLLAILLSVRVLDRDEPRPSERLDLLGLVLLSPGLALFTYGMSEITSSAGIGSAGVLVPGLGGLVLLVLFVVRSLVAPQPLLDLRLFRSSPFTGANLVNVLGGASMIGSVLVLPLYYQVVRGESALAAGLLLVPQGVGAAVVQPIAGRLVDRGKGGWVVLVGLPLMALGFVPFTQVTADTSYLVLSAALFVNGIGAGCSMGAVISTAMRTVDRRSIPRASATLNIILRVGGAVGTALFAVVLQHEFVRDFPSARDGLGALASVTPEQRAKAAPSLAAAFGHMFWWPLATAAIGTLAALLMIRDRTTASAGEGGAAGREDAGTRGDGQGSAVDIE